MSKEECKVEAGKYKNRKEFQIKNRKMYLISLKNGWLDIFYGKRSIYPKGYWTKEKCQEEANKYDSRREFRLQSKAYSASVENGWLHEICSHLPGHKPKGYWTKERCQEEANKYNCRVDFEKYSISACLTSRNNNWIDEICSHMKPQGNLYKRCIYAIEFSDNHVYIGLTYNINKRFNKHINDKSSAVYKHILKTKLQPNVKVLTDFLDIEEAKKLENNKLIEYFNDGWIPLNKAKCGAMGSNKLFWTKEKIMNECLKYSNKEELKRNSSGAWHSAQRNGWLSDLKF